MLSSDTFLYTVCSALLLALVCLLGSTHSRAMGRMYRATRSETLQNAQGSACILTGTLDTFSYAVQSIHSLAFILAQTRSMHARNLPGVAQCMLGSPLTSSAELSLSDQCTQNRCCCRCSVTHPQAHLYTSKPAKPPT